jgi:hypothetical protein
MTLRRMGLAVALSILVGLYVLALLAPAAGLYHDDAIYVVTAKAMAEGQGYRVISLPGEIAQTKYPFVFPIMLSVLWKLYPDFPANVTVLKLVPFGASIAWLFLVFALLKRESGRTHLALILAILTALSPWVLFFSSALLTETLFAALTWAALLSWHRYEALRREPWLIVAALLSGAAFMTRTVGLSLILAGVLILVWRRELAATTRFVAYCLLAAAPWLMWLVLKADTAAGDTAYYTAANYGAWNLLAGFTWAEKFQIFGWNVVQFLAAIPILLGVLSGTLRVLLLPLGTLMLLGLGLRFRQRVRVTDLFAATYVGIVLLWAWPPTRFWLPVYPLLLLYAWEGLRRALRSRNMRWARHLRLSAALATILLVVASLAAFRTARLIIRTQTVCPEEGCTGSWWQYQWAFDWLRSNTPPDAVLTGNLDPTLYLYTGRKAARPFTVNPYLLNYSFEEGREPLGSADVVASRIVAMGADYLIYTPSPTFGEDQHLGELIATLETRSPDGLQQVAEVPGSEFRIFRINRAVLAAPGTADENAVR